MDVYRERKLCRLRQGCSAKTRSHPSLSSPNMIPTHWLSRLPILSACLPNPVPLQVVRFTFWYPTLIYAPSTSLRQDGRTRGSCAFQASTRRGRVRGTSCRVNASVSCVGWEGKALAGRACAGEC
eukprot:6194584-Pleurochrysis_carterae.AAC.2